ncbi:MAG TPA: type II secretion system protein GspL [Steroidobacteraceae bacterium]|nr:type II secretion system protein GspL [Steroidobacteraceae bacterium]
MRLTHGTAGDCAWLLTDAQGQPLGLPAAGPLAQAAVLAPGRRIGVLVPTSDVLFTEVELPSKGGVKPQQVVPFALEEQLAADIETLHFAIGARVESSGRTSVAVVTRVLMNGWLASLAAAGLAPEFIGAEAALLPDNPGHTIAMLDGDMLCLRRSGHGPLALPADQIAAALTVMLGDELASEHLLFYVSPEEWKRRAAEIEALRGACASLKVQLLTSGPLPLLAQQLAAGTGINLLSGDFAPKSAAGSGWRRWRLAAILAAALFAVHVTGLSIELVQQSRAEHALDESIGDIARIALPSDSGSGAVRTRIEQRLRSAQDEAASGGLMPALAALAQALNTAPGTTLQGLSLREGGMDLRLKAADAETLEHVNDSLRGNGWQAELTSGGASASGYEGRIQMRPPGAPRARRTS